MRAVLPEATELRPVRPRRESNIPKKVRENCDSAHAGGTDSGTVAGAAELETLAAVLRSLSAEDRNRLVALLIGQQIQERSDDE